MRDRIILLFVILSIFEPVFPQTVRDSLRILYQQNPEASLKIDILNELAWEWAFQNLDSSLFFADEAIELSEKEKNHAGLSTAYMRKARVMDLKNFPDSVLLMSEKSLALEEKLRNEYGVARAANQIGNVLFQEGKHDQALDKYLLAYDKFLAIENKTALSTVCVNIGAIYRLKGNYEESKSYYLKGHDLIVSQSPEPSLQKALVNSQMGMLETEMKNYDLALKFQHKAIQDLGNKDLITLSDIFNRIGHIYLELPDFDSAIFYLKQAFQLKEKLETTRGMSEVLNNFGVYFAGQGELDSSSYYYQRALGRELEVSPFKKVSILNNLGSNAYKQSDYASSLSFFLESYQLMDSLNMRSYNVVGTLKNISLSYAGQGKFDLAYQFRQRSQQLRDSLETSYRSAVNLSQEYEETLRKLQISEKEQELQIVRLKQTQAEGKVKTLAIIILCLLFFSLAVILWLRIRENQAEHQRKAAHQQIKDLVKDQALKSYEAMLAGQDSERKRMAQDLHDELGSILSMVKMNFSSMDSGLISLQNENRKHYEKAMELLDKAVSQVRRIAYELGTEILEQFGLTAAIEDLAKTINLSGNIKVETIFEGIDDRFSRKVELELFKIVGELITNVLRHAHAKEASIQLIRDENELNITVEDDGQGFNVDEVQRGMGLKGISSRVHNLKGELNYHSSPEKGTIVVINIPIT